MIFPRLLNVNARRGCLERTYNQKRNSHKAGYYNVYATNGDWLHTYASGYSIHMPVTNTLFYNR